MGVDMRATLGIALGAIKDRASMGRAMICRNNGLSEIEIAVIRATSHGNSPIDDKFMHEILFLVSNSPGSIPYLADRISHRLSRTTDSLVALKTLVLIHRLLRGGNRGFEDQIRDAHISGHLQMDSSWWLMKSSDSSVDFLRNYAGYLTERMSWVINPGGKLEPVVSQSLDFRCYKERSLELVFHRLPKCQLFLDKVLNCWQFENLTDESSKLAQAAMSNTLKESFQVYNIFCEGKSALLDMFFDLTLPARAVACDILEKASEQSNKLQQLYTRCKESMKSRNLEFPVVEVIPMDHVKALEVCLGNLSTSTCQSSNCRSLTSTPVLRSSKAASKLGRTKDGQEEGDDEIRSGINVSSATRFSWTMETKISYVWVLFDDDAKERSL